MEEILTYRRYKEMIETCEKLQSTETVRAHITAYLKRYQNDNPTMAVAMMEIIESENPSIDIINEEYVDEVSAFIDLEDEIEHPQLRYLYTLLLNSEGNSSIQETLGDMKHASEINPNSTFKSAYSGDKLELFRNWLIREGYIDRISSEHFLFLFSNRPIKKYEGPKLVWKLKATSGSDNAVLFGLICKIAEDEYTYKISNVKFLEKIRSLIVPEGVAEFKTPALRKAFGKWEDTEMKKIKTRAISKKYRLLLDFIETL